MSPAASISKGDENELRSILDAREPDPFEPADTVVYPEPYTGIPALRQGYRYYRVTVEHGGVSVDAVLRRAVNPLKGRVELFAERKLKDLFASMMALSFTSRSARHRSGYRAEPGTSETTLRPK